MGGPGSGRRPGGGSKSKSKGKKPLVMYTSKKAPVPYYKFGSSKLSKREKVHSINGKKVK